MLVLLCLIWWVVVVFVVKVSRYVLLGLGQLGVARTANRYVQDGVNIFYIVSFRASRARGGQLPLGAT